MTLLEALCKANECQGGTIHQFCDIRQPNFERFQQYYKEFCIDMRFIVDTKEGFYQMAKRNNYTGLKF